MPKGFLSLTPFSTEYLPFFRTRGHHFEHIHNHIKLKKLLCAAVKCLQRLFLQGFLSLLCKLGNLGFGFLSFFQD